MAETLKIVCPMCASANRVPESRLSDRPVCGKCKTQLLPTHPIELDDSDFANYISRTEIPAVVDFWAPWCGPCKMMAPAFAEAAQMLSPRIVLVKVNTEVAQQAASVYGISSIPTMIVFQGGREIARQSGALSAAQIAKWAHQSLAR